VHPENMLASVILDDKLAAEALLQGEGSEVGRE
jgi:hypothetical protein